MSIFNVSFPKLLLISSLGIFFAAAPATSSSKPNANLASSYFKIVGKAPPGEDRYNALVAAASEFVGTPAEGLFNYNLSTCEDVMGRTKPSEDRLAKLTLDDRFVDFGYAPPWGGVDESNRPVVAALVKHFNDSPNLICDEALLQLMRMRSRDEARLHEAWLTANELTARYPNGDRTKEDKDFLDACRKQFNFPPSFPTLEQRKLPQELKFAGGCFQQLRRPHMIALGLQVNWYYLPDIKNKLHITDAEVALADFRFLQDYSFLLTDEELLDYSEKGLSLLNNILPGDWKGPGSLEDAKTFMKNAKDLRIKKQ